MANILNLWIKLKSSMFMCKISHCILFILYRYTENLTLNCVKGDINLYFMNFFIFIFDSYHQYRDFKHRRNYRILVGPYKRSRELFLTTNSYRRRWILHFKYSVVGTYKKKKNLSSLYIS